MRGLVNKPPDLRRFLFYVVMLVLIFFRCWAEARIFFVVCAAMLIGSLIEIPLFETKTRKPDLSNDALGVLSEIYKVNVAEEIRREGSARAYNTTVTMNVGGFLIPLVFAILLLFESTLYFELALSYFVMTMLTYLLCEFRQGIGIVVPSYVSIFALPLAMILMPHQCSSTCLASLVFVPASLGICTGILIFLASLSKEKQGSAFISLGGTAGDGGFGALFIIAVISSLLATL